MRKRFRVVNSFVLQRTIYARILHLKILEPTQAPYEIVAMQPLFNTWAQVTYPRNSNASVTYQSEGNDDDIQLYLSVCRATTLALKSTFGRDFQCITWCFCHHVCFNCQVGLINISKPEIEPKHRFYFVVQSTILNRLL